MESQELRSVEAFAAMLHSVLEDALTRLGVSRAESTPEPPDLGEFAVISFRQTWPDGSCGFGGIAAQVLTDAQTVVVSRTDESAAVVYVRGEFAYLVERPNSTFWDGVGARRLPGVAQPHDDLGEKVTQ